MSLVFLLIVLPICGLYLLVWPNTYLSQINISFWPKPLVKSLLEKKSTEYIDVIVEGRRTRIIYSDLNITLRVDKTMESLEMKSISDLLSKWMTASRTTMIQPVFEFGEGFENRVSEIFSVRPLKNESTHYDNAAGLFVYSAEGRKARVDAMELQVKLITFFDTKKKQLIVEMVSESSDLEKRVAKVNSNLKTTFSYPLELKIQDSKQKISLGFDGIVRMMHVETEDFLQTINFLIDKGKVSDLLAVNGLNNISPEWAAKMIEDNLSSRYEGKKPKQLVLGADSGPNTDGKVAKTYIEVDLSQQKMFFFENGNLFKTYIVSTGLNYPTPVGNYKIINKLPMGFSNIFHVWMPWWMAFDYREDLGAYLGIHELPYKLVEGEKIYRFGNYIGSRKTGGCIALSPGDSKEVFDRSFPGMDMVVYQ
ncbi:MAG: ErfK family cell surface protein [Microgenomates group bacterium GW2011_GWC1_44_37]|nr:MAG: hypothetical protein UW58_C0050G0010 [Candidatus Collierbacteria bacterium GW2011_GWC2_44_30]KKT68221.1 MAG: ErfK family cell surface protein [Microgenomates group bacterium GW2011_GWC1_44_37]